MRMLAIDFGRAHLGLALAVTPIAEPLEVVARNEAITRIQEICDLERITHIVMGISEGEMADRIRKFSVHLQAKLQLPIIYVDETLSSQETRVALAKSGMSKSKREAKIDHMVAARFLQEYVDSLPNTSIVGDFKT